MNVSEALSGVKAWFEKTDGEVTQFLEQHLPVLSNLAEKAAANPVVDAVMASVHLSPEWFTALADVINKAEGALSVAADAKAQAEAAAAAAQAPPADPSAQSAA
jgi:hypothetical protein